MIELWAETLGWIEASTARDALIHTTDLPFSNESIRSNAKRSLLTSWMDALAAPYAGSGNRAAGLRRDAQQNNNPADIVAFAARYDVDYLIVNTPFGQPEPGYHDGIGYIAEPVYQNAQYIVYQIRVDRPPWAGLSQAFEVLAQRAQPNDLALLNVTHLGLEEQNALRDLSARFDQFERMNMVLRFVDAGYPP
jgi:hypothetical protein